MRKIILLVFPVLFLLSAPGLAPAAAQSETGYDLLAAVNAFRAGRGMGPFEINDSLMVAAQRHANWCAATGTHSHTGEGGSRPQDRATAAGYVGYAVENFASGTSGYVDIAWTIQMWSSDDIHLGTMLSTAPHAGAGVASNGSETWYVLVVGRPSASPPATRAPAASQANGNAPGGNAASAIPAVPVVVAAPNADGTVIHIVQQGQTLWDIAVTYGVPLADLLALNYLAENALLHPGDAILVRLGPGQSPPPPPTLPAVHVVQAGETLWDIALIYGVDLDELRALNDLAAGAVIVPGMELRLRPPDATATATPPPSATPSPSPPPPTVATLLALAVAAVPSASPTLVPTPSPPVTPSPAPDSGSPDATESWAIFLLALGLALIVGTTGGSLALLAMRRAAQTGPTRAPKR